MQMYFCPWMHLIYLLYYKQIQKQITQSYYNIAVKTAAVVRQLHWQNGMDGLQTIQYWQTIQYQQYSENVLLNQHSILILQFMKKTLFKDNVDFTLSPLVTTRLLGLTVFRFLNSEFFAEGNVEKNIPRKHLFTFSFFLVH